MNQRGRILQGDVLEKLATLDPDSIDCVITSPPYYGLRDYGQTNQIGLETSLREYLDKLQQVMQALRRVLKPTGSIFWNIGDTYAGSGKGAGGNGSSKESYVPKTRPITDKTIRDKSIYGVPQRFLIDCIDAGWVCRNDIIWHKPNSIPSPIHDRFKNAHEHIFFLTKNPHYYFDLTPARIPGIWGARKIHDYSGQTVLVESKGTRDQSELKSTNKERPQSFHLDRLKLKNDERFGKNIKVQNRKYSNVKLGAKNSINRHTGGTKPDGTSTTHPDGKNPGDVLEIKAKPNTSIHIATYPLELPKYFIECACPKDGIILDPFAGSGTTLEAAALLNRDWIGIELNPEYAKFIKERMAKYRHVLKY